MFCWKGSWKIYFIYFAAVYLILRMTATGRSYTQNFFKVQYIIIQAVLRRKFMEKFAVTDEKIFRVCEAFDRKI